MSTAQPLPTFLPHQFASPAEECDAIMKGGVTSGIVYPYAILEIATKYRFRSLGGTSAGAIAAAFAAAAEYARSVRGDPGGFTRLQSYCNQLPDILLSLFQPDPEFRGAIRLGKWLAAWSTWRWVASIGTILFVFATLGAAIGFYLRPALGPSWPAVGLGALALAVAGAAILLLFVVVVPLYRAKSRLLSSGFGACGGLTIGKSKSSGLTDWLYEAMQDIAFGSPKHPDVLTFGHLEKPRNASPPIFLRMVTTNLSMGRPHTLPQLGIQAGFYPAVWEKLFPLAVMDYLKAKSGNWNEIKGACRVPGDGDLPVICAVRMSLSFPLLFKAIPILSFDHEFVSVVNALGGKAKSRLATLWFSDGGLSSNFPIHLFDTPLPARPTFAISLDSLQVPSTKVKNRVLLPETSAEGSSVQVTEIKTLGDFGWRVLASAKDWQDQLASAMTGQRERIARIFLDSKEGGLNLAMPAAVSRALMGYGLEAGQLFTTNFNFDEHRWRRLLVLYRDTGEWIDQAGASWTGGFDKWFRTYRGQVLSYRSLTMKDRQLMATQISDVAAANASHARIKRPDVKFPGNTGQIRVTGRY